MKVVLKKEEEVFKPVTLTIVFETKAELDCFGAVIGGTAATEIKKNIEGNTRLSKLFNVNIWCKMTNDLWYEIDKIMKL